MGRSANRQVGRSAGRQIGKSANRQVSRSANRRVGRWGKAIALLGLVWLFALPAFSGAQAVRSSVTLRRENITVRVFLQEPTIPLGGIFLFRVQVTAPGDLMGDAVQFALPEAWSDRIIQLSYISDKQTFERGGRLWSTLTYTYRLAPLKVGRIRFDGLQITALREKFLVPPIEGVVLSGATFEEEAPPGPPVKVTATVSPRRAFVGEQVVYTMQYAVSTAVSVTRNPTYEPPSAEGFRTEEFPQIAREWKGGYEIQKVRLALFPLRTGKLQVGSAKVRVRLEGATGEEELSTPILSVTVQPLPQPAPSGFQNLVGQVLASVRAEPDRLPVGDTLTVRLRLEGTADLRNAEPPRLQIPNVRVGLPRDELKTEERDGRLWFRRTFEWRLVPLQAGTLTIPAFSFPYFDPQVRRYRTATTNPVQVTVLPGQAQPTSVRPTEPAMTMEQRLPLLAFLAALLLAGLVVGWAGLRYWRRSRWLALVPVDDPQLRQAVWTLREQGSEAFRRAVRAWLREQIFQRTGVLLAPNDPPERVQQLLQSKGVSETAARFAREVWERTAIAQSLDEALPLLQQVAEVPRRL